MNQPTNAIILVAGEGKRLLPFTLTNPKCFAQIDDKRILSRALETLAQQGCRTTRIIVGHHADFIQREIKDRCYGMKIQYIHNANYQATNSMYSLALGLRDLKESTWVIEGDVVFESSILRLPALAEISWFVDSSIKTIDGAYVESDSTGLAISLKIVRNLKLLQSTQSKSVGMLKLTANGARRLSDWLEDAICAQRQNDYYDLILGDHMDSQLIRTVDVAGHRWFEIDSHEDLAVARTLFQS